MTANLVAFDEVFLTGDGPSGPWTKFLNTSAEVMSKAIVCGDDLVGLARSARICIREYGITELIQRTLDAIRVFFAPLSVDFMSGDG